MARALGYAGGVRARWKLSLPFCLLLACNRGGLPDADEELDLGRAADLAAPAADLATTGADLGAPASCGTERQANLLRDRAQISLPRLTWIGDRYALLWYDDTPGGRGSGKPGAFFAFVSADGALDAASIRPVHGPAITGALGRLVWNGAEFGVTYISGPTRQARFVRLSPRGDVIAGSDQPLGTVLDGVALAWNGADRQWAVAWTGSNDLSLARLGPTGAMLGTTMVAGGGLIDLAYTGRSPLLWNGTSYALAYRGASGQPGEVAEIGPDGRVQGRVTVGNGQSFRLDLAWDGAGYGVVRMDLGATPPQVRFLRIEGGKVVAGTDRAIITSSRWQGEPAIVWDGQAFYTVWGEADPSAMPATSTIWGARLGKGGEALGAPRQIAGSYGWWPSLEWSGCELAVPYVFGAKSEEARVVFVPGPRPLGLR